MAPLDAMSKVDIAELAFYGIFILLDLLICFKQGLGRNGGWIMILIFCAIRISAAACDLAAQQGQPHPAQLEEAAVILNGVGISLLLGAILHLLRRVNSSMHARAGIPGLIFTGMIIPIIVAVVLGIIGGVDLSHYSNYNDIAQGQTLFKVAVALFLGVYGALLVLLLVTFLRFSYIRTNERTLFFAVAAAMPFLLVRLVYASIENFDPSNPKFNRYTPNIWVYSFVDVFEEFLIVMIIVGAGMITPRISLRKVNRSASVSDASGEVIVRRRRRRRRRSKSGNSHHSSRSRSRHSSHRSPGRE